MTGIELIRIERERQMACKAYTPEHDDAHDHNELSQAAVNYIYTAAQFDIGLEVVTWPWDFASWKPSKDPVRNLAKAGALIAAEIDRLQRLATKINP